MSTAPTKVVIPVIERSTVGLTEAPPETTTFTDGLVRRISSVSPFWALILVSSTVYTHIVAVVLIATEPVNVDVPFALEKPPVLVAPNCASPPPYDWSEQS